MVGGGGATGSGAAGLVGVSFGVVVPLVCGVLEFSLSLMLGAGLFDFADCLEPPPMRLRRMPHFPFPASSSGKSADSVDMAEAGRTSDSGVVVMARAGFG